MKWGRNAVTEPHSIDLVLGANSNIMQPQFFQGSEEFHVDSTTGKAFALLNPYLPEDTTPEDYFEMLNIIGRKASDQFGMSLFVESMQNGVSPADDDAEVGLVMLAPAVLDISSPVQ